MFKAGLCPYCEKKIDYKKRAIAISDKNYLCRHCNKNSQVIYIKSAVLLGIIFVSILIALNILILSKGHNQTIIPNFVITVVSIIIYLVLLPLTTEFIKKQDEEETQKLKKNRHRHKRTK